MMGRMIVEQGLASREEVESCLALWRDSGGPGGNRLGELLVRNGVVTENQMNRVRTATQQDRSKDEIPGYKVLEKLGEGAMAKVFRARQVSLDRIVAIKVLPRRYSEDKAFIERFYAEGRAAAKLNHNNIVQAYDVGQAGEHHYFVMEYVEGTTVFDHVQQHGKYSEAEALRIIIQIAKALDHAHEKGFMHRDVKPKNIMFTREGVAKLADMGLARQVSDREAAEAEAGKAFGTPFYISPEQIRGSRDVDQRADVYGLGATLYFMLTGRVPFEGPNPSAVMHKHLREPLTPPDHINPELSAGISEIVEVMMAKDREERYASCADLLEDLLAVEAGEPPMIARRRFDFSSLAAVERRAEGGPQGYEIMGEGRPSLVEQPLFWLAIVSMLLNAALLAALFAGLSG